MAIPDDLRGTERSLTRRHRSALAGEFDPQRNALNVWRLILATGVIVGHSWPLTGRYAGITFAPAAQLVEFIWVDGFFAISGFLVTWSWCARPRLRDYFVARGLRILPGLWVCLVVIAFVIAPASVAIQDGSSAQLLFSRSPIEFVIENSAIVQLKKDVGGTPTGIPWPGQWNGSLWTLIFETACYCGIAALGVTGLLRRRWAVPALFVLALFWSTRLPPLTTFDKIVATPGAKVDIATALTVIEGQAARLTIMFLAGMVLYQIRNRIPAKWSWVAVSVLIVLAASLLPDYRLVGAIPLAYAIIVSGILLREERLRLRNDLSYGMYIYAWPMQQLLVVCGLGFLHPMAFAVMAAIATLPLAAISWFCVEKPALSLKSRLLYATMRVRPG